MRILYDFLGEVLLEKPVLQEGKKHSKFLRGYHDFIIKTVTPVIPMSQILEWEKYFLEKYCILENEEILISFLGFVRFKKYHFDSRIFITNIRMIVLANSYKPGGGSLYMPWAGLIFNMFMAVESRIRKMVKSSLTKSLDGSVSADKVIFGYQFPLSNPTAITLSSYRRGKFQEVNFTSNTETESYKLAIVQQTKIHKNWEEILNRIVELLQNSQE